MKLKQQVSKRALITLLISLFVVPVIQAQQNQQRPKTPPAIELVPNRVEPSPALTENIRKKGNVLQALAIYRVLPKYPPDVKPDQLSGIVIVNVKINKAGNVVLATALTGDPVFRKAAADAVRGWIWVPTQIKDAPEYVEGNIRFDFDGNGVVSINTSDDPEVVDVRNIIRAKQRNELEADLKELRAAPTPDLYAKVGRDYFNLNRKEEAREIYIEGINRFPREIILYLAFVGVCGVQDQTDELLKLLEQGAQLKPEPDSPVLIKAQHSVLLYYLGLVYLTKERYAEAKEVLEQALTMAMPGKNSSHLYGLLGVVYAKLKDRESAVAMYQKLVNLKAERAAWELANEICKLDALKCKCIKGRFSVLP